MTALAPPVGALLDTATALVVPGIARWLGVPAIPPADEPEDALAALCARLSTTDHTTQET